MTVEQYDSLGVYSLKLVKDGEIKFPVDTVDYAEQAAMAMQHYLQDRDREHLAIIMIDGQNTMIGISTISIGGIAGASSNARDVIKIAILCNASGIIMGHNHPSGSLEPSEQDMTFTKAVKEGCEFMGITLLDHIIVSSSFKAGSMSFASKGLL